MFNGDPIRFDIDEILRDGQHRLEAAVRAGETIEVLVVYGLAPQAQETMDLGRKRTVADALQMRGLRSTATLAGGLNLLASWMKVGMLISRDSQLTPKRAEALLDEHPQLLECASPSTALERLATPSIWCAATYHHASGRRGRVGRLSRWRGVGYRAVPGRSPSRGPSSP